MLKSKVSLMVDLEKKLFRIKRRNYLKKVLENGNLNLNKMERLNIGFNDEIHDLELIYSTTVRWTHSLAACDILRNFFIYRPSLIYINK